MNAGLLAASLRRKISERGVLGSLKLIAERLAPKRDEFDRRYGTDTTRKVDVFALGASPDQLKHATRYEATDGESAARAIRSLPIDPRDYIFVDIGAGKGRVVLVASLFPFKQAIGVELSSKLTRVMRKNFSVFKEPRQKCKNLLAICQDALSFELPNSNLVLFLYNPFDGEVMRAISERVEAFSREHGKKVFVIYRNAQHREAWNFPVLSAERDNVIFESA